MNYYYADGEPVDLSAPIIDDEAAMLADFEIEWPWEEDECEQ